MFKVKKLLLCFMVLLISIFTYGQVTTSSLSGKVSDAEGPLCGVVVKAVNTSSEATVYSVTNENGDYSMNALKPGGPYELTYTYLGYQTITVTEINLPLGENIVVDQNLISSTENLESVVVVAHSGNKSIKTGARTSISQETIESMPVSTSRSLNDILKLSPQASSTTSGLAVGGGNYRGSYITVDGAAFNNSFGIGQNLPAGGSPISLDAIEQMSVNIAPFDVRMSGFQGAAINAITKSGTNEWHASAYNYYTSDKVRGSKVAGEDISNNEILNNTVGITVGGPIVKNKLFFFVNGEYTFDKTPGSSSMARPNTETEWGADTKYNRPTETQLNDIKSFLADKYGYDPGRYQGYSLDTPDYKIMARLDWNINSDNNITLRFSHTHTYGSSQPSSSMSPIGGTNSAYTDKDGNSIVFNRYSAGRQSQYAMYFESARYYQEQNFTTIAGEWNSRFFDGNGNNVLRATWSNQNEPRSYVGNFFPTVDILSNDGVTGTDTYAMLTTIGVDPFTYGNLRKTQTLTVTDEFSYIAGKHNLIAGAQFELDNVVNGYMQGGAGWFIYDSWQSFVDDVTNPSSTTGPVAFMITHANLDNPAEQAFPSFNYYQTSVYFQDEMSLANNFKLTAGLRFEVPAYTIPTDNVNKDFARIAETEGTSVTGLSTGDLPKVRLSVAPRIGFSWDVLKNKKFVIRGGSGIFTGRIPNVWLVSAIGNDNCLQMQYINKNVMEGGINSNNIHFTNDRTQIINNLYQGSFVKQDLAAPTAGTILSKDLKMPCSWKNSLSVDVVLPGDVDITIEGLYSQNFNEVYATTLGYKKDGTITLPGEPSPRSLWVSEGLKNKSGQTIGGYYIHNTDIQGNYGSVSIQASKSFNFGLNLSAAYTYSSSQSVSDGNGDQISEFANTYCLNGCNEPVLGYANYVAPHRAIANISYTINEGKHLATKLSLFYEGYNIGYFSSYSYSRVSYLMNNVSGAGSAAQLIYIPTDEELVTMPFTSEENKADYAAFLASDNYTSKHRGEYMKRNGVIAPWLNRFNVRIAQDFKFNIAKKPQTVEVGVDINNIANLFNSNWGVYKQLSSNNILTYKNEQYTFTKPVWKNYNNLSSTWSMLIGVKYFF